MPAPIFVPFGPFEPDSADLNAPVCSVARNVYPSKTGYLPLRGATGGQTGTFPSSRGGAVISTGGANYSAYIHKIVSSTHSIRRVDSSSIGGSGTEVGTGFTGPSAGEFWRFAKFGNFLIAANPNDDPQVLNWSSAGSFSALGGTPPRATGVFTIDDFVFLTGLVSNKRKLRWSSINDHTGWIVGTNLCDEQEFPDGGDVYGIVGGKSGFVIQNQAIRTFQFLPGDAATIFEFSKLDGVPGCAGPYAWAKAGQSIYYYSEEGFCSVGPGGFRAIGAHKVDRYFLAKVPLVSAMQAVADPYNPRIFFGYRNDTGGFDGAMVYDWQLDRWSEEAGISTVVWIDAIEATGGNAQMLIGFGGIANALCHLSGNTLSGTLTTAALEIFQSGPNAGQRALISALRPVIDGAVSAVSTTAREKLTDAGTTTQSTTVEANGRFSLLASGAYHQLSVVTGVFNSSTYHKGMQVWATPDGEA